MSTDSHPSAVGIHFGVEIDGQSLGYFTSVDVPALEVTEVSEDVVFEGGRVTKKYPGPVIYGDITLRRPLSQEMELWEWIQTIADQEGGHIFEPKGGKITAYNQSNTVLIEYTLTNAWPKSIRLSPDPDASSNEVFMEEIVLAVEHYSEGQGT